MKRTHRITVAIIGSLVLGFVSMTWSVAPFVGPLLGVQRTPDEMIEFITRHNIIVLVNPVPVIKGTNGSYYDWAESELEMRRKVSVVLWVAGIVVLGLWAARRRRTKDIDNKASQPIAG